MEMLQKNTKKLQKIATYSGFSEIGCKITTFSAFKQILYVKNL